MFEIKKTPILILSSPRTGSEVLGEYLQIQCGNGIQYFREPDYGGHAGINDFRQYFFNSKNFILKCHFIFLHKYGSDVTDYLLQEAYKIRIRRKDLVKQIASFYIADSRNNKWHFNKEEQSLVDVVPINIDRMRQLIGIIKYSNYALDTTSIKFDLDLYYEDLPEFNSNEYYISPKPINYVEVLDKIRTLL